jgi:CheY-like chemotaxis protein
MELIVYPYSLRARGEVDKNRFKHLFASIIDKTNALLASRSTTTKDVSNEIGHQKDVFVLLADDDSDDSEFFKEIVSEIAVNISVEVVADGIQLMNKLKSATTGLPEILFLDLNMPGMDGKHCLKEIKNNSALAHIPVVIYSTSSSTHDIHDTYSIGANLYLTKPNNYKTALSLFRKVFSMDFENMPTRPTIKDFTL